jgi:DNA polymerase-3 subunit delta'
MDTFSWPIVGHSKIQQFLQKSLVNNKLAHAYLFSGPEHLGKSLLADQFIASILCHDYHQQNNKKAEVLPCQACVFCQQFSRGIHPDVYKLNKEEDKKNISVEQVREMHKFLSLSSFLNSYKIAVIGNAEDLSESAQNALLKVLEEPNPKTILILITSNHNLLLPTITSRCQLVKFRALSAEEIFQHLVSLGSSREQARIFTALANGQIGRAIDYLNKPELFTAYLEKMNQLFGLFNQD